MSNFYNLSLRERGLYWFISRFQKKWLTLCSPAVLRDKRECSWQPACRQAGNPRLLRLRHSRWRAGNPYLLRSPLFPACHRLCPHQESNLNLGLRSPLFYPLNYGGSGNGGQVSQPVADQPLAGIITLAETTRAILPKNKKWILQKSTL